MADNSFRITLSPTDIDTSEEASILIAWKKFVNGVLNLMPKGHYNIIGSGGSLEIVLINGINQGRHDVSVKWNNNRNGYELKGTGEIVRQNDFRAGEKVAFDYRGVGTDGKSEIVFRQTSS